MKLCCFVVTVFLGNDATLRVTAGTSALLAQSPNQWFTLNPRENDPDAVVSEILAKLKDALEKGGDGIDVTTDGRLILKTPSSVTSTAADKSGDVIGVRSLSRRAPAGPRINLNTATLDELRSLPGVGPVIAGKIVAGRPFRSVDDLMKVEGIGVEKMGDIKPRVTVE